MSKEAMKRAVDKIKSTFWEGYVPEPDKRQQALDKKAENARELGLDYEPAQQEPVAWIERWYGSGPERGWWIVCGRDHIAHLGPSEFAEEAASKIVTAHNTTPPAQRKPLSNGEIYTAYITATNQTLRPQDERLALAFARAIEAAHGIKENT
jgi:hypothetical protein